MASKESRSWWLEPAWSVPKALPQVKLEIAVSPCQLVVRNETNSGVVIAEAHAGAEQRPKWPGPRFRPVSGWLNTVRPKVQPGVLVMAFQMSLTAVSLNSALFLEDQRRRATGIARAVRRAGSAQRRFEERLRGDVGRRSGR